MIKLINIIITIFILPAILFCQGEFKPVQDKETFKKNLSINSSKVKSIESDILQEKNMSILKDKIKSKGKFYFKKSNQLRWEYNSPVKYMIIFNGDKITVTDENKTSYFDAKSNQMFKKISEIMTASVQGNIADNSDFTVNYTENSGHYLLKMIPQSKMMKEYFKYINVFINKKDWSADRLELFEPSGDYTKIDFQNKKINQPISDEKFNIK